MAANDDGKIERRIFTNAYTPACPAHGTPMTRVSTGALVVYFKCFVRGCPHTGKAPRVLYRPVK